MYVTEVKASLPFPLRVGKAPYSLRIGETDCQLSLALHRHQHLDERLGIAQGDFDLSEDRWGWASYSHVSALLRSDGPIADPVNDFLSAVNVLIEHARDLFNVHWIRPVEEADLFQLSVEGGGANQVRFLSGGRARGITLPVAGLQDQADRRLRSSLSGRTRPPNWRLMQLDAREASATGRYGEAIVLCWTALEAACRQSLPHLAESAGLTIEDLERRLKPRYVRRGPFLSREEVVRWASSLNCIHIAADLVPNPSHNPESLTASVRTTYAMRNHVVHQGVSMDKSAAEHALDAVGYVLWSLRLGQLISPPSDPLKSWRTHFGRAHHQLERWATGRSGRVLLFNASRANPRSYVGEWWNIRRAGDDYLVEIQPDVREAIAATLFLTYHDLFADQRTTARPTLRVTSTAKEFLVAGLLDALVGMTMEAIDHARVLLERRHHGLPVVATAKYAIEQILKRASQRGPALDQSDVRYTSLAARLASYLALTNRRDSYRFVQVITKWNPALGKVATAWAEMLADMDPQDDHAMCPVLRRIHDELLWLDSIVVDCPIEGLSFGTRQWPLGEPK